MDPLLAKELSSFLHHAAPADDEPAQELAYALAGALSADALSSEQRFVDELSRAYRALLGLRSLGHAGLACAAEYGSQLPLWFASRGLLSSADADVLVGHSIRLGERLVSASALEQILLAAERTDLLELEGRAPGGRGLLRIERVEQDRLWFSIGGPLTLPGPLPACQGWLLRGASLWSSAGQWALADAGLLCEHSVFA